MQAEAVTWVIGLEEVQRIGDEVILVASCLDYDTFQALPKVLQFEGNLYAKTGWNSDLGRAYWKPSRLIATRGV